MHVNPVSFMNTEKFGCLKEFNKDFIHIDEETKSTGMQTPDLMYSQSTEGLMTASAEGSSESQDPVQAPKLTTF